MMSAPELLKAQMPTVRQVEANLRGYGYVKGTPEWVGAFNTELAYYRQFVGLLPPTKELQ